MLITRDSDFKIRTCPGYHISAGRTAAASCQRLPRHRRDRRGLPGELRKGEAEDLVRLESGGAGFVELKSPDGYDSEP